MNCVSSKQHRFFSFGEKVEINCTFICGSLGHVVIMVVYALKPGISLSNEFDFFDASSFICSLVFEHTQYPLTMLLIHRSQRLLFVEVKQSSHFLFNCFSWRTVFFLLLVAAIERISQTKECERKHSYTNCKQMIDNPWNREYNCQCTCTVHLSWDEN